MNQVIINSPSLDPQQNVSGISSVVQFIIHSNNDCEYVHFELGKKDGEKGGLFRVFRLFRSLKVWKSLLKEHPTAIVHYNFPLMKLAILRDYFFIKCLANHRRVIHVHGGNYLMSDSVPSYLECLLKKVFLEDTVVIVLSELEKTHFCDKFPCKNVYVLPNCVSLGDSGKGNKNEDRILTIGYIGRITADKGMKELYEACKILVQKGIDFRLRIAGKEEVPMFVPKFSDLLSTRFDYLGVVSGHAKDDFLSSLDIFVLPSYYEGLPISLIECMGHGAVPVCTNVGSISQVVKDGTNGSFVPIRDIQGIVDSVIRYDSNRGLLHDTSVNARQTILSQFNPSAYIHQLNHIYQTL